MAKDKLKKQFFEDILDALEIDAGIDDYQDEPDDLLDILQDIEKQNKKFKKNKDILKLVEELYNKIKNSNNPGSNSLLEDKEPLRQYFIEYNIDFKNINNLKKFIEEKTIDSVLNNKLVNDIIVDKQNEVQVNKINEQIKSNKTDYEQNSSNKTRKGLVESFTKFQKDEYENQDYDLLPEDSTEEKLINAVKNLEKSFDDDYEKDELPEGVSLTKEQANAIINEKPNKSIDVNSAIDRLEKTSSVKYKDKPSLDDYKGKDVANPTSNNIFTSDNIVNHSVSTKCSGFFKKAIEKVEEVAKSAKKIFGKFTEKVLSSTLNIHK